MTFTATNLFAEAVTYTAVDVTDGAAGPRSAAVTFTNAAPQLPRPTGRGRRLRRLELRTSLPYGFLGGCVGAAGLAFDRHGDLYVVDEADGHLYRFGPAGGVANASTRVTTSPYPLAACVQGLAFSQGESTCT